MKRRKNKEIGSSARGMYIRNTANIPPKWKGIRNADIMPNWSDICNTADILELADIGRWALYRGGEKNDMDRKR